MENNIPCYEVVNGIINTNSKKPKVSKYDIAMYIRGSMIENGLRFFRLPDNKLIGIRNGQFYSITPDAPDFKAYYSALTHLPTSGSPVERSIFELLISQIWTSATLLEKIGWSSFTDKTKNEIYFNLGKADLILHIPSVGKITEVKNLDNPDNVFLKQADKIEPIKFCTPASHTEFNALFSQHICCSEINREIIKAWIKLFLLLGFAPVLLLLRLTGKSSGGKSTILKLISMLIYGAVRLKTATISSNYADAQRNPIIFLDNIESSNFTRALCDFVLTGATGIEKEKRVRGTDHDNTYEKVKALICSSGIESIGEGLAEITNRTIYIEADRKKYGTLDFVESDVLEQIKENRDKLISRIVHDTQTALQIITDKEQKQKILKFLTGLEHNPKDRAIEFILIMTAMLAVEHGLEKAQKIIMDFLAEQNELADEQNVESGELGLLIYEWLRNASNDDAITDTFDKCKFIINSEKLKISKYTLESYSRCSEIIYGRELFTELRKVALNKKLNFPYRNVIHLCRRLENDIDILNADGITVRKFPKRQNRNLYQICLKKLFFRVNDTDNKNIRRDYTSMYYYDNNRYKSLTDITQAYPDNKDIQFITKNFDLLESELESQKQCPYKYLYLEIPLTPNLEKFIASKPSYYKYIDPLGVLRIVTTPDLDLGKERRSLLAIYSVNPSIQNIISDIFRGLGHFQKKTSITKTVTKNQATGL